MNFVLLLYLFQIFYNTESVGCKSMIMIINRVNNNENTIIIVKILSVEILIIVYKYT